MADRFKSDPEPYDAFPGFPHLKRQAMTDRGPAELLEVNRTSDGFLIGVAWFEGEDGLYLHEVFLGRDPREVQR